MKHKYIFHNDHYYHTLKQQIGEGIPVFHGVRQRGGGLGSVLGNIAKYALPLVKKYILPHAKSAVFSTISDLSSGTKNLKQVLKKNSVGFMKNVGTDVINSLTSSPQTGKGIINSRKRKLNPILQKSKTKNNSKNRKVAPKRKKSKKKTIVKKKGKPRSKLDIFT